MDPSMLGPVTGPLALSIEMVIGTAMEPMADMFYGLMIFFGELGL
ncbi:hypothetical protein [Dietzia alimentaria]|nr:hypothetical protein [Dietzia alimentaria]